ncbi:MAG: type II toxin-antitoxin system RelE/ParE family toxin [Sulfuricurvum sp.]
MEIVYHPRFKKRLLDILDYIALDKISASINFATELAQQILQIPSNPYQYRKSLYFDDEQIRDMTYKKFTIVYEVDTNNSELLIFDIFNRNKL